MHAINHFAVFKQFSYVPPTSSTGRNWYISHINAVYSRLNYPNAIPDPIAEYVTTFLVTAMYRTYNRKEKSPLVMSMYNTTY